MNFKKYLDFRLLGLVGSILLIISQFLSWFSGQSLLTIYILTTSVAIEDSFLYLFPLICGIICLVGTLVIIYNMEYKINSVIINFIGLGFFMIFILEIIPRELLYIPYAEIGFYFSIVGSILIFFEILNILLTKHE
ncbi:MAG TPA: hypothetical protein VMV43_10180 [Candidatus Nanopelagicaceae bacterium]|nr:hypothetical protein [Candidatus Nanopelagicaceae bacterium]